MGYARYWKRPVELPADTFATWSADVAKVAPAAHVPLEGYNSDGPSITSLEVAFNGAFPDGQEWFIIRQTDTNGYLVDDHDSYQDEWFFGLGWRGDACKTNRKPYDILVVAALALLTHYFPNLCEVDSDGDVSDWDAGIALARSTTGFHLFAPNYSHMMQCEPVPAAIFAKWSKDVARVIAATDVSLAGPDGTGEPIVSQTEVAFNGVGEARCQPFRLIGEPFKQSFHSHYPAHLWNKQWSAWECKTMGNAGKRYDEVVTAALLLLLHHFKDSYCWVATKASREAWEPGRSLVERATELTFPVSKDQNGCIVLE